MHNNARPRKATKPITSVMVVRGGVDLDDKGFRGMALPERHGLGLPECWQFPIEGEYAHFTDNMFDNISFFCHLVSLMLDKFMER